MEQDRKALYLAAGMAIGIAVGIGLALLAFGPAHASQAAPLTLNQTYANAVRDAMVARPGDICGNLTAITPSNPALMWSGNGTSRSVLVVTWTKYGSSYPVGNTVNTTWGTIWVTVVPQIRSFFAANPALGGNLTLRADELLGLPPNASDLYFVELWVRPGDLFRPAYDSRINVTTEQLMFPNSTNQSYVQWFDSNIVYSYFTSQYPWTRLGYTYDWGDSASKFGLSEFVIRQNSTVLVESVTPTLDYLQTNSSLPSPPLSYPHCRIPP